MFFHFQAISSLNRSRILSRVQEIINTMDPATGYTALHWAARRKNTDMIKLLAGTYKQVPQSADVLFIRTYCQASESAHTQNTRTR